MPDRMILKRHIPHVDPREVERAQQDLKAALRRMRKLLAETSGL